MTKKKQARSKSVLRKKSSVKKKPSAGKAADASSQWQANWHGSFARGLSQEGHFLLKDGHIVDVSGGALALLGLKTLKGAKGKFLADYIDPAKLSVTLPVLSGRATPGDEILIQLKKRKGGRLSVSLCSIPIVEQGEKYLIVRMRDASREVAWRQDTLMTGQLYRHLFDTSQALICVLDRDGYILLANEAGSTLLGHDTSAGMAGRKLLTMIHPEDQKLFGPGLKKLLKKKEPTQIRFMHADTSMIDVEASAHDIGDGQIMIEARDVTERVETQSALEDREARLHAIVDSVADAIVTINDNGKIISFNKAAETIFGYREKEILGQNIKLLIGVKHAKHHGDYLAAFKQSGKRSIIGVQGREELGMKKDGTEFPLELSINELQHGEKKFFTGIMRDITERKVAEAALRKAHDELESRVEERTKELTQEINIRQEAEGRLRLSAQVIENLSEGVVIIDPDFKIRSVNPAYTTITGYTPSESVGNFPNNHTALCRTGPMFEEMWAGLESEGQWEGEFWNARKDGEEYAERLSVRAIIGPKGEVQQFAAVIADITKRKQDEERILYQANYDSLTGLPNRSLFIDRLNQSIAGMSRSGKKIALLFIDLDGFKLVNDTLGHDIGDLLLKEAAVRLGACIRTGDTVARLGGDEFTIVMPNLEDPKDATIVAQRSLEALEMVFNIGGHETFVSASIGITVFPDDASDSTGLLKNADAAMYRAKDQGKANYQYFTTDMNQKVQERLVLKNGLVKARDLGEFKLFYQPKMNIKTNTIVAVEALMRWDSPELGIVTPNVFIPLLEESGMVVEVGAWAIKHACEQHVKWIESGIGPIKIAVNLSARQLREPSFVDIVKNTLKETSVATEYFEIEITESMLMSDAPNVVAGLTSLHDIGIHISMDDFGTGYSSLSYLRKFPIDTIKIDRSFVSDITTNTDDAEIIRTIINMGRTLNRNILAEGVETQEQLDLLKEYNCDEIQGYFISPPLIANDFADFHTSWVRDHS